ncbi:YHYH domain-containing protein [Metaclostridioides mangenotii]|uniref:YHYH domain-containing protein n=1 Tax=Metaclostridioides mangenotii TaxID=1540 RepID=A0ABS4EBG7_9FIRM|nr:hypothetical protein [Clostridioides mangenotii]
MNFLRRKSKNRCFAVILTVSLMSFGSISFAHSGRTDSSGGHHDYKNKSGLGSYHYHHGYGPHLHTNGCPYGGGGSSSSGSSSSSGNSASSRESEQRRAEETAMREAEAKARQEEKDKERVKKEGIDKGYENGYSRAGRDTSSYSGSYVDNYNNGYNEGYNRGLEQVEEDAKEASEKGYNLGVTGEDIENPYSKEILLESFKEGYEKGFGEYKSKKKEEYKAIGKQDGAEDKPMMEFEEDINKEIKAAYIDGYNSSQKVIEKEFNERGFKAAIKKAKSEESSIKNEKHSKWYKAGYENGKKRLDKELEKAYQKGLKGEEFQVETAVLGAKEYLKEEYDRGKEDAKTNGAIGAGVIGVSATGLVLYRRNRKKNGNRKY